MKPFDIGFAVLAFLGAVGVAPVWWWLVSSSPYVSSLSPESQFLAALTLPGTLLLLLAGWVR